MKIMVCKRNPGLHCLTSRFHLKHWGCTLGISQCMASALVDFIVFLWFPHAAWNAFKGFRYSSCGGSTKKDINIPKPTDIVPMANYKNEMHTHRQSCKHFSLSFPRHERYKILFTQNMFSVNSRLERYLGITTSLSKIRIELCISPRAVGVSKYP